MVKKTLIAVCALIMLCTAGCSDSAGDSSSQTDTESQVSSESFEPDSSSVIRSYTKGPGEKLKAVYKIFAEGIYTFECELTGTNVPEPIKITRTVSGGDSYQLQQEKLGNHGTVTFSGKSFDFDYVCGMYRETAEGLQAGIIEQIVKDHIPETEAVGKSSEYDCEQYTYTGDTFITVIDFYFDKTDGHLVKYTMTYSVEGKDDIVETRTVLRLDNEADTSVFNAYFADTLVNFDSMSEPQKLGFCQGLCATWGITADEMFELGVSSDSLGKIDYDTLFLLIHTYGKSRTPGNTDSSSAADSSVSEDESSRDSSDESVRDSLSDSSGGSDGDSPGESQADGSTDENSSE